MATKKLDKPIEVELELGSKDTLYCTKCERYVSCQTVKLEYKLDDCFPMITCKECLEEMAKAFHDHQEEQA